MTRPHVSFVRSLAVAFVATALLAASSTAAPVKTKAMSLVGTLEKVDGQTLTVQTPKGEQSVMLATGARIQRGSTLLPVADLSAHTGDRVKVRYRESNGHKEASSLTLSSAKHTHAATSTKTTAKK